MSQDALNGNAHQPGLLPITPTLVIGLGKFGRQVGVQLMARLQLTEEGLQHDGGLVGPLLVRWDAQLNRPTPGLVRIMTLDWGQWFNSNYTRDVFLKDVEITPGGAEQRTPPQCCEDNRHPDDYTDARIKLRNMEQEFLKASDPLCAHDMPGRKGYNPPGQDNKLNLRIFVVCAARENESAFLVPELLALLGERYVLKQELTKGIRLLCYAGDTPREEHKEAVGDDKDYDALHTIEVERICSSKGLLQILEGRCKDPKDPLAHTFESCYLLDVHLANRQRAVQLRHDEPDEVVVAAALALTMLIGTDGDQHVRRALAARWYPKYFHEPPGFFTSFGIASYAIDHPKLRRLVYGQVVGAFLLAAQPMTEGEKYPAQASPADEGVADDKALTIDINHEVNGLVIDYIKRITFKTVKRCVGDNGMPVRRIDHRPAIDKLRQSNPSNRQDVKNKLEDVIADLNDDMRSVALTYHIQDWQQKYEKCLTEAIDEPMQKLYDSSRAPLTRIYRFLSKTLEELRAEAKKYNAPLSQRVGKQHQRTFVQNQAAAFDRAVGQQVTKLQATLLRPSRSIGALGRASLAAPVVLLVLQLLPFGFWEAIDSVSATFSALTNLPTLIYLILITLIGWPTIYLVHHFFHLRNIRRALVELEKTHAAILKEADQEAWRDALADVYDKLNQQVNQRVKPLCKPFGIVSKLRDTSFADQFLKQDSILEHIFFNEALRLEMKKFSKQLAEDGILWNEREHLLRSLIETQQVDQDVIGVWLRKKAEDAYQSKLAARNMPRNTVTSVTDLVNKFLENQTTQRLEEMWHTLSIAAVHLLRYNDVYAQDDPTVKLELFGVHGQQEADNLRRLIRHPYARVLDSADRLRWIYMDVHTGLYLEGIRLSAGEFSQPLSSVSP